MTFRSFLGAALGVVGLRATRNDADDRWYQDAPLFSLSGQNVNESNAMKLAVFYAGCWLRAKTIAGLPLKFYEEMPNGRKPAPEHPVADLFGLKPNRASTAFQFRAFMQLCRDIHGNGYAQKVEGPRGPFDQLIPLNPTRMEVEQQADYSLVYTYTAKDGRKHKLQQEEVFHLRGLSTDGVKGLSLLRSGIDVLGLGLAMQDHTSRWVKNDSKPGGVLEMENSLDEKSYNRLKESWSKAQTGANRGKTAILEKGVKFHEVQLSNVDMQAIESKHLNIEDICRIVDVPPHKVRHLLRSTFSNIEEQNIEWGTDTLLPECINWEQQIGVDFLLPLQELTPGRRFFAKHNLDAVLRGNYLTRQQGLAVRFQNGSLTINEWRRFEDENPIENEMANEPFVPVNMVPLSKAGQAIDQRQAERRALPPVASDAAVIDEVAKRALTQ